MTTISATKSTTSSPRSKARTEKRSQSPFGGFRKRSITAGQLVGSVASLAPELSTMYRVWLRHHIYTVFREELMLAVSRLNDCRYCSWGHQEWAHIGGASDEELAQIEQLDPSGFDRRKWLAITCVRALVKENVRRIQPELRREMPHKYSPREIREIELIAKVMDIGNRDSNTWDAMLSRLRGSSRRQPPHRRAGSERRVPDRRADRAVRSVPRIETAVPRVGTQPDQLHQALRREDGCARADDVRRRAPS